MSASSAVGAFVVWDYVVFAGMLLISAAIGIYYAIADGGQKTSKDFLMGGRSMTAVPVALSLTASFMSAVTVLGTPSEVYRFGAMFGIFAITYTCVVIISAEIFLPVFYRLGITSTYEGGLKAVVWTDVFQVGVMVAGFTSVVIRAVVVQGGISPILNDSYHGGRLNFWESLYVNLLGLWAILACAVFAGLCLYSVYKDCDPWTANIVSAPDQLMPYLVLDLLRDFPGVPGLFVACAYSGTLRFTIWGFVYWDGSASLSNGQSPTGMEATAALSVFGMIGGPLLGLFALGILFPWANSTGGLVGLVCGFAVSLWVGIGSQVYSALPESTRPLHLSTAGCNLSTPAVDSNWTAMTEMTPLTTTLLNEAADRPYLVDHWYSLSYLYFSTVGTLVVLAVGLIVSLLTVPSTGDNYYQPTIASWLQLHRNSGGTSHSSLSRG
ncbi:Sodium-coupled monocarboxylate transporter 1 [Acipenser ruthenus]|uniref:Sodium-coupled monocarboxylate transporter 1 n=1 Tax=Acipenser ruthenus TaxID=7906 RepID=A0A444UNH8_ACIRT|nr:Sodium-coupled monocarboxylate transporter 1 [Acipenser ruthenus]